MECFVEIHRWIWNAKTVIRNRKYGILIKGISALLIVVTLFFMGVNASGIQAARLQKGIAKEIIRFHVIANSDSDEDQAVKMKVKDGVITMLKEKMQDVTDKEEARKCLLSNMDNIQSEAIRILRENGYSYEVHVALENTEFPIKVYGDVTLPAGVYEALCIRIGKALGHNWWCIVFPTLCFVDPTYGYVSKESKKQLKYVLTQEEYDTVTEGKGIQVKVKFKLWDYIKQYMKG